MPNNTDDISPETLKEFLSDGFEIALIDIREHGQYGEGHPFFSVNCPFSTLEYRMPLLVPCHASRVILFDQSDEGIARQAVERVRKGMGYTNVFVLKGGADGWKARGYELFKGINVPSKAFGEMVEKDMGTPSISAKELNALIEQGENIVILDGRTPGEYARMSIPTARSCPNAELGYRIDTVAPDPETMVIINCAGRTRSIIGAQTLINLGIANRVVALRNGTQGWQLSGLSLSYGSFPEELTALCLDMLVKQRVRAYSYAKARGVPRISLDTLSTWQADNERSLYLFDVRAVQEFEVGHYPGATHAPGGQLVQATDQWIATRHARIVLTCDLGIRAVTTCYWLRAMGHDVYVLDLDVSALEQPETGFLHGAMPSLPQSLRRLSPSEFLNTRKDGALLLDASEGQAYRLCHIVGSQWVTRSRLPIQQISPTRPVVVCGDAERAGLVAADLVESGYQNVAVLDGQPEDWAEAGLSLEETPNLPTDEDMIDFLFFVHDRHSGSLESARAYLEWETGLIAQMDVQERKAFDTTIRP